MYPPHLRRGDRERGIVNEGQHRAYLDRHPYREVAQEDMEAARLLLEVGLSLG